MSIERAIPDATRFVIPFIARQEQRTGKLET
jgi:hypothetical protein